MKGALKAQKVTALCGLNAKRCLRLTGLRPAEKEVSR